MHQALTQLHTLLPDLTTTVIKMISSMDTVAVHLMFTGTHEGQAFGAPPTYRQIRFIAFDMHRVSGDRIVETCGVDVLASAPGPVHSGFAAPSDMRMGAAVFPADVARASLAALGRQTTVVPGLLSKVLTYLLATLPRTLRTRVMGSVMHGMTRHQEVPAISPEQRFRLGRPNESDARAKSS